MALNLTNFLLSLAFALAADSPPEANAALGQSLFIHQLPSNAADPAAVLRIYGAPAEGELRPVPAVSVQCMTHAMDAAAGLLLARGLYDALHDDDNSGRPRQTWSIAGKAMHATTGVVIDDPDVTAWDVRLIVLASGGGPGVIGRDEAGRWEIAFNFDVRFSTPTEAP